MTNEKEDCCNNLMFKYDDQGTGVTPSYCGQCSSTCRKCLKDQLPDHPLNSIPMNVSL